MRKIVFVDIDTQLDFMDKNGKLYVQGAEEIVPNLRKLTKFAKEKGISIVSSLDTHKKGDPEFKQFPPHCVRKTKGQDKIAGTKLPRASAVRSKRYSIQTLNHLIKGKRQILVEKGTINVFSNPNFKAILKNFDTAFVYGVATDYCVKEACLGILKMGLVTYVVVDAIRTVSKRDGENALRLLRQKGARFIKTEELVERLK